LFCGRFIFGERLLPRALIHAVFKQLDESFARLVSRRLRPEDHEVADVRVGDDVADQLFDADVFGLDGAGEGGPAFKPDPDQVLDIRRNLLLVVKQDDSLGDRRVVVAPQIAPFFRSVPPPFPFDYLISRASPYGAKVRD
jgi:hypothetical protein